VDAERNLGLAELALGLVLILQQHWHAGGVPVCEHGNREIQTVVDNTAARRHSKRVSALRFARWQPGWHSAGQGPQAQTFKGSHATRAYSALIFLEMDTA